MSSTALARPGGDLKVIGLIGVAHFFSHFFQLVLPPLFPLMKATFGVDNTALGLLMTVFYGASGLAQTPAGFLVDRFGADRVLVSGLSLIAVAMALVGSVPVYWALLPLAALAGMGNSVFHPSDYSILTSNVAPGRLARAYSVHTLGGTLGWAAAPVTMLTLTTVMSWRAALVVAGLAGLAVAAGLVVERGTLRPGPEQAEARTRRRAAFDPAVLRSRPIVACFVYFATLSVSMVAVQTFLPTTLNSLYGTSLDLAGYALTGFLLGSAAGTLAGGILADRMGHHERIIAAGLACAAVFILLVGSVDLDGPLLVLAMAAAGFLSGGTMPSRDMLVRAAAPKGATGKVFGFVYSGLDLGASITPLVIGVILDHGHPRAVFLFVAASLVVTILSAQIVNRRRPAPVAAAE